MCIRDRSYEVLKLVPKFERSLLLSEEGLVYSWTIEGEEISTTRDLEYTIDVYKRQAQYSGRVCQHRVFDFTDTF